MELKLETVQYQNYQIAQQANGYFDVNYRGRFLTTCSSKSDAVDMVHHHISNVRHIACEPLTIDHFKEVQ